MYSAQGDFTNATKEMNVAVAGAPDGQKQPCRRSWRMVGSEGRY